MLFIFYVMSIKIKQDFRYMQSEAVFNPITIIHIKEYSYDLLSHMFIKAEFNSRLWAFKVKVIKGRII